MYVICSSFLRQINGYTISSSLNSHLKWQCASDHICCTTALFTGTTAHRIHLLTLYNQSPLRVNYPVLTILSDLYTFSNRSGKNRHERRVYRREQQIFLCIKYIYSFSTYCIIPILYVKILQLTKEKTYLLYKFLYFSYNRGTLQ